MDPALVSATPAAFRQQMVHLKRRYHPVSLSQVLDAFQRGAQLPARAVHVTVDDAYRDFGEIAWPIMRELGIPVTVFVPSAYPSQPGRKFWWDRLHEATREHADNRGDHHLRERLRTLPHEETEQLVDRACLDAGIPFDAPPERSAVLSWEELRALGEQGVEFGAHTRGHVALTHVDERRIREEIRASLDEVKKELGYSAPTLAYPYGLHDDLVRRVAREEGCALAFTVEDGLNVPGRTDPMALRRTNISLRTSPPIFALRMLPWFADVDRWRHRGQRAKVRRALSTAREGSSTVGRTDLDPRRGRPARVAYVMSQFPKISETFVLYEMQALETIGARVEVFPLRRGPKGPRHAEARAFEERAHFVGAVSWEALRATLGRLARDGRRTLRVYADVLRGTWGSRKFFFGALVYFPKCVAFAERMEALGIDHVHAHFASHPALAALVIHRLTGIPYSFTAHGSDLHVDRTILDEKVASAAFVVAVSSYNRDLICETCGEQVRDKVAVIHCGADPSVFAVRNGHTNGHAGSEQGSERALRIVCVASLEEVKGHTFLLRACRLLLDRGVDVGCDLVGGGPLLREIREEATALGLDGHVTFHGAVPRSDVGRIVSAADVAVLASHPTRSGRREGIPVALMEAMMSGLPVVASGLSGIPELVVHERTGFLVPPGDPWTLADRLECLADAPLLRRSLGEAGRARVAEEFDLPRNARVLLGEIERRLRASRHRDN
jgi:glycosyltransferase involved in cell wall biosynthesis/peptidoglycan/xylan/chitin deacetylase (PgdA/CDA1 family)